MEVEMDMITASEANSRTLETHAKECKATITMVMEAIEDAIDKGKYSVWVRKVLLKNESLEVLRDLGYNITFSNDHVNIDWKK